MLCCKWRKLDPEIEQVVAEKLKARVRAMMKHPLLIVKRVFGYGKMRYRELAKNTHCWRCCWDWAIC